VSRIGRMPVAIPAGVKVKIEGNKVTVEGSKGKLTREFHPDIKIAQEDGSWSLHVPVITGCTGLCMA